MTLCSRMKMMTANLDRAFPRPSIYSLKVRSPPGACTIISNIILVIVIFIWILIAICVLIHHQHNFLHSNIDNSNIQDLLYLISDTSTWYRTCYAWQDWNVSQRQGCGRYSCWRRVSCRYGLIFLEPTLYIWSEIQFRQRYGPIAHRKQKQVVNIFYLGRGIQELSLNWFKVHSSLTNG